jgi:dipeptide/tripeptide permease
MQIEGDWCCLHNKAQLFQNTMLMQTPVTLNSPIKHSMDTRTEQQVATSRRHPRALYVLFFTEMWERFAYYLMVGILLLYLIDNTTGGKGMDQSAGADIVGSFIALVFLTRLLAGWLPTATLVI